MKTDALFVRLITKTTSIYTLIPELGTIQKRFFNLHHYSCLPLLCK